MAQLKAWAEYVLTRMNRLDWWNPAHIPTNAAARTYRFNGPGFHLNRDGKPPLLMRADPEKRWNTRYFPRDYKRREVEYYPDTPLSLNHALLKDKPLRPDWEPRKTLPKIPSAFGLDKPFNTPLTMGLKKTPNWNTTVPGQPVNADGTNNVGQKCTPQLS
uniref:Uncharacterized protein n=1 Tax=Haptolina ericina TaxID=156174 RepID=A0A7S3BM80_9EUKA